jgi:prophage antirepressor-like protein
MDIIKTFLLDETDHQVNILVKGHEILFQANQIAKILDLKNIRESIKNYNNEERVVIKSDDSNGISQNTIFLTKIGVYKLLFRSNKKEAEFFRKWVFNVLDTIEKTGKYELQNEIDKIKEENLFKMVNDTELLKKKYDEDLKLQTHFMFMNSFNNKNIAYFMKIKDIDDKLLFKIGSTQDIQTRGRGLKSRFGCDVSFFKVFECDNYDGFENFLINHLDIKRHLFSDNTVYGINNSNEVFLMNEEQLNKTITIANRNLSLFMNATKKKTIRTTIGELRDDIQNLKEIISNKDKKIENNNQIEEKEKNDDETDEINYENNRGICTVTGSKIQRYSIDGKELLETYKSLVYVLRDGKLEQSSRKGIFDAANNNTNYHNFRWALLDRNLPDDTVQKLGETVIVKTIRNGFVCEINNDKTEILKVYSTQKEIAKEKGFKSGGQVSTLIKNEKPYNNNYFICWTDCADEMQQKYLINNTLPEKDTNKPNQVKIQKLDPETKELLHTYLSITEVTTKYKLTRRTLISAINGNIIKREFYWKYA